VEDAELYTRWVQFGVFSPILRLHSTNNPYHERRPWAHGRDVFHVVRDAMQLRHALIPYLYSMAWRNHTESTPLIAPMYHVHPKCSQAYCCPGQYYYGSELVAAPFVHKMNLDTGLSRQVVWLPEGDWFDFFSGEHHAGGRWRAIYGGLNDIPVFAKAGAIIPLAPKVGWGGVDSPEQLDVCIFAGADGRFGLYEDDGDSTDYLRDKFCLTEMRQTWSKRRLSFTIRPAKGDTSLVPVRRRYRLIVRGVVAPESITAQVNGEPSILACEHDQRTETLTCSELVLAPSDEALITLETSAATLLSRRDRTVEKVRDMLRCFRLETRAKWHIDSNLSVIIADVDRLGEYWMDLQEAQATALVEVMRKTALDRQQA
jgi:hypothetical protein